MGIRGDEHHLVWWTSSHHGSVLRWTTVENIPEDVFEELGQRFSHTVMERLPSNVRVADPPAWSEWHPSFRYFRLAQLSDDLVEAFRNMFLAVESVLDHVLPAAGSGLGETQWIRRALDTALVNVDQGGRFTDGHGGTATDYVVAVFYRFHRGSMFHSKLSYGADRLRVPHLEHERSVDQLEQGLSDLRVLYVKLASAHLALDYRGGFMLAQGGFDAMFRGMLGRLTLYVTDDDTPGDQLKDETDLNPRGRWLMEMHTRNAKRLERRMTRHFLGVCAGRDVPQDIDVRGVVAGVDGVPVVASDTEEVLRPQGFDRMEVVMGLTALNKAPSGEASVPEPRHTDLRWGAAEYSAR